MKEPFDLNKQDKKLPFKVPENYFKELPTKISAQVQERPQVISWPFQPVLKWAMASLVILITFGILYYNFQTTSGIEDTTTLLADVPAESILAFLEDSDLSNFDLYAELDQTDGVWNDILYEEFQRFGDVPDVEILDEDLDMIFLNFND
jgi:hypothetical protein